MESRKSSSAKVAHAKLLGDRQSGAEVFKLYSQAKLGMMREALAKLDRDAHGRSSNFRTGALSIEPILFTFFTRSELPVWLGSKCVVAMKGVGKGWLVGPPRFELGTSCTPNTKARYTAYTL